VRAAALPARRNTGRCKGVMRHPQTHEATPSIKRLFFPFWFLSIKGSKERKSEWTLPYECDTRKRKALYVQFLSIPCQYLNLLHKVEEKQVK
jgi:hypothetical protein